MANDLNLYLFSCPHRQNLDKYGRQMDCDARHYESFALPTRYILHLDVMHAVYSIV
jgi:hypothetical protein